MTGSAACVNFAASRSPSAPAAVPGTSRRRRAGPARSIPRTRRRRRPWSRAGPSTALRWRRQGIVGLHAAAVSRVRSASVRTPVSRGDALSRNASARCSIDLLRDRIVLDEGEGAAGRLLGPGRGLVGGLGRARPLGVELPLAPAPAR